MKNEIPSEHDATVEDKYSVRIKTNTGEERVFNILDTAGEEDYQVMMDNWIKTADGFLLVFAINDKESLNELKMKVTKIKSNNKEKAPIILVGNKCDMEDKREVSKQSAMEYAQSIGAKYYETSALNANNDNCRVVFQQCAHMIIMNSSIETSSPTCPRCSIW